MSSLHVRSCAACGSRRIRRARAHSPGWRLLRRVAGLERYACGDCHHEGWRLPPGHATPPDQTELGLPARRVEARDRRMDSLGRRALARSVAVAVALGAAVALLLATSG